MAFTLPSLPNFTVQQPPPFDPVAQRQKQATLSGMLDENALRKQLAPLQVQEQQQKAQQAAIQTQTMQAEADSQKAMMKAWSDPEFTKKLTGTDKSDASGLGFDPDAMTQELISRGVLPKEALGMTQEFVKRSQAIATTNKDVAQTGEANAAMRNKGMKILADKIGSILDLPTAKAGAALDALKQDLVKNPKAYAGIPQEDLAHVYSADLEHLPAMANLIGLESQIADFHKSKAEAATAGQKVIPEGGGLSPDSKQQVSKDIAVATNPQIQAGKVAVAAAEGKARAQAQAGLLTGDALDQNADKYNATGTLPPGMRSPGMAAAIINRAAERSNGQPLAANSAEYKANLASYENVTKTLDTLSGFESAAIKNIDMFKGLASKLPDSGVPWINTPLRKLDEKAVGAEWMPAINAARQIANREVARVTNDPKLSGVLSDSARGEIAEINPADATFAQIMHVTDLMKQDMANVHSSLGMQKSAIGKRLGIQPQAEAQGGGSGMTRIKASDGSLHDIPSDKLDAAKKLDPKLVVQ